ncbi:MAG TPA: diacylglycerol kinase family protein [Candidatus Limnocylindria bacterium]
MTERGARPAAIFLNEGAGSARAARTRRAVEVARRALDADLHVTRTRDPVELATWLGERVSDYETVVVAGGDGSLAAAYNALRGRSLALGYIPAGFGNATAHLLRLPRHPAALAQVLATGEARLVDLLHLEADGVDRLALFAGVGWDALVADRYAAAGSRGLAGWATAITRSLPDLVRRTPVLVEVDGVVAHEGPMEMLAIGTTPYYGRGLLVNPGARPDAGRLTARVYRGPLPAFALDAARWLVRRAPGDVPLRGTSIRVRTLDGRPLPVESDGDSLGRRDSWTATLARGAVRLIGNW